MVSVPLAETETLAAASVPVLLPAMVNASPWLSPTRAMVDVPRSACAIARPRPTPADMPAAPVARRMEAVCVAATLTAALVPITLPSSSAVVLLESDT
jgi:hypothetical protein